MPNRKKPNTLFLPARIKRLMQKDEEVGKLAATVPVIAARALEQFLQELITRTASVTTSLEAKTLTPDHIRQHIYSDPRLSFLQELANKTTTGPNNNTRSLSISSATSTPITNNRPSYQAQLSIPYQDPTPIPTSTISSNTSNLLHGHQEFTRSYSKSYCSKVKAAKRSLEEDDDEDDDDEDKDDGDGDDDDDDDDHDLEHQNRATRNNHHHERLMTNQRVT